MARTVEVNGTCSKSADAKENDFRSANNASAPRLCWSESKYRRSQKHEKKRQKKKITREGERNRCWRCRVLVNNYVPVLLENRSEHRAVDSLELHPTIPGLGIIAELLNCADFHACHFVGGPFNE